MVLDGPSETDGSRPHNAELRLLPSPASIHVAIAAITAREPSKIGLKSYAQGGSEDGSIYGMARPLRIQLPGLTYHVHSRGNARAAIYADDCDRQTFLALFADVVDSFHLTCPAFCLMENHYHLVITTRDANLSRAMRALNGRYAQGRNRRHGCVGHVFQGRFGAKVVQEDAYLLTVCKYVVLNPVRKGLVESPDQWRWSSYRASAGLEPVPSFVNPDLLWQVLGAHEAETSAQRYRRFVGEPDQEAQELMRRPIIGEPEFVARFDDFRRRASREVPRRERDLRPPLESLFAGVVRRADRDVRSASAYAAGYSMPEIARYLGVDRTTILKAIHRIEHREPGSGVKKTAATDLTPVV